MKDTKKETFEALSNLKKEIDSLVQKNKDLIIKNENLQDENDSLWAMMDEITKSDIENYSYLLKELKTDVITRSLMITKKIAEAQGGSYWVKNKSRLTLSLIPVILIILTITNIYAKEPKSKFYDFDEQIIDGEIKKPTTLYTNARQQVRFDRLLKLKKSFIPKLFRTAKEKVFK